MRDPWFVTPSRQVIEKMALPNGIETVSMDADKMFSLHVVRDVAKKSEDAVEKSAWDTFRTMDGEGANALKDESGAIVGHVVESGVHRGPEFKGVKPGDWLMGIVWQPGGWDQIQRGKAPTIKLA